jgi:hypothetical protein
MWAMMQKLRMSSDAMDGRAGRPEEYTRNA